MTSSFADQVRAAVQNAEGVPAVDQQAQYLAVLDELLEGLGGLGVGARLQVSRDSRRRVLYLFPLHRPARASAMLTFFLEGDGISVSGERTTVLCKAEELQGWLLGYVQLPAFVESLRTLREQAELPVEARLRVFGDAAYSPGDVLVAVTADDQAKLDAAKMGSALELVVERIDFPSNRPFADPPRYPLLDSAGLRLAIDDAQREGETLRLKGRRAT